MNQLKFIILLFLIFLLGCSLQFRSPIVIKRTPKEEEKVPRPKKIVPPPPLTAPKAAEKPKETTKKEPTSIEEPMIPEEVSGETPEVGVESETVETTAPKDKTAISTAKNIVILAPEYLKNTEYKVLEKIIVKDVSQAGFNKQEAREALQFEAFRRFGSQAKGITNITYGEKTGLIPGSKTVSEVSGEVITWEGKTPPQKKVIEKEKETKPEPAKELSPPAPNTKTEPKVSAPSPDTKTDTKASAHDTAPDVKTKTESPAPNPQAKPEPLPPSAPTISEQQLEQ
jgi:hypothetical protein